MMSDAVAALTSAISSLDMRLLLRPGVLDPLFFHEHETNISARPAMSSRRFMIGLPLEWHPTRECLRTAARVNRNGFRPTPGTGAGAISAP